MTVSDDQFAAIECHAYLEIAISAVTRVAMWQGTGGSDYKAVQFALGHLMQLRDSIAKAINAEG